MARILVVDDERDIRTLLADTLSEAGHEVIEAGDGYVALQHASNELPDLILLDVMMPWMDGLQVLKKLRGNPTTEILTAETQETGHQTASSRRNGKRRHGPKVRPIRQAG